MNERRDYHIFLLTNALFIDNCPFISTSEFYPMFPGNVFYGIREIINKYCGRNTHDRIPFNIFHGINQDSRPLKFYQKQPLKIWTNNLREAKIYSEYKYGTKPLGAPFLYHLENIGIKPFSHSNRLKLGSGILVLPSHSTNRVAAIVDVFEFSAFICQLSGNFR